MTSCPTQAATLAAFSSTLQSGPVYRKCATMHARRCESAGVCHTTINGEHETSKPYEAGDYLLIGTEGERYSIPGATFLKRYDAAHPADADTTALYAEGFRKFEATGRVWAHLLTEADVAAHFPGGSFMASWNEPFTVHAGDWLCMPHPDGGECYRIEAGAFASTYRLDGS